MARRKTRRTSRPRPSTLGGPWRKSPKESPLHEGSRIAGMDRPNGLVPLDEAEDLDKIGLYLRWPLALLEIFDEDAGENLGAVFVDIERHETQYVYEWRDHPPTWMDPHLFMEMARRDERVQKVCRIAFKKNDKEAWARLVPLLQSVFDEKYLPYAIEQFEKKAVKLLAHWLLRNYAYRETDPKTVEAEKQRKKARRKHCRPVE